MFDCQADAGIVGFAGSWDRTFKKGSFCRSIGPEMVPPPPPHSSKTTRTEMRDKVQKMLVLLVCL
eukprot:2309777-Amphidinium_carterae.1